MEFISMDKLYEKLSSIVAKERILCDEPMNKHTTFRVGGSADYFVCAQTVTEVQAVVALCKKEEVPYYILGNGSNLLVGDKGYRGVILQIAKEMNAIDIEGTVVRAQAGALLSRIGNRVLEAGLTGFEFASGIPGTLGGAVVMNAGAYGGELKDVLEDVTVLDQDGNIKVLSKEQLALGYRTSIIAEKKYIVLEASMQLRKGEKDQIKAYMEELRDRRVSKQPLEYPSAGSTFKRPEGYFAGKLIQDAGLRGLQVGGAQVSEKHCGFVINKDGATAADIVELMNQVIEKVYQTFGVTLEPEVKRLGEF